MRRGGRGGGGGFNSCWLGYPTTTCQNAPLCSTLSSRRVLASAGLSYPRISVTILWSTCEVHVCVAYFFCPRRTQDFSLNFVKTHFQGTINPSSRSCTGFCWLIKWCEKRQTTLTHSVSPLCMFLLEFIWELAPEFGSKCRPTLWRHAWLRFCKWNMACLF